MPIRLAAVTLVIAAFTLPAFAQQSGSQQEREACTPDVYRLCEREIPDEKRIVACLKKNQKQLSPACAKVFAEK